MTLDEAIQHCKEVAESGCTECCKEHGQLALWLTELKSRRIAAIKELERVKSPETNADRIRQMTDDEELLSAIGTGCYRCAYRNGECDSGYGEGCIAGNLEWLKKEAQEDAGADD